MSRLGWVAAIAIGWAGCAGSQHAAPRSTPTIVVVDPGAEPRRRIRYELTLHAPERFELDSKLRTNAAFTNTVLENGNRLVDYPTIHQLISIEVSAFEPGGTALLTAVVEDASTKDDVVDAALRRRVDVDIAKTKGDRISWRMSPSGSIADLALDAPGLSATQREQATPLLEAMSPVPFPDADIGAGASWQVHSQITLGGVRWDRTVTCRLKELTDSTATVETVVEGRASSQALSVEPNATIRLTSATGHATSDLVVPLHQLVATGRSVGTSEMNLQIVRGHLRITSTVTTETITSVSRLSD